MEAPKSGGPGSLNPLNLLLLCHCLESQCLVDNQCKLVCPTSGQRLTLLGQSLPVRDETNADK